MLILPLKAAVRADVQNTLGTWLDSDEQQVSFDRTDPLQFVMPKPDFSSAACHKDLLRLQSLRNSLSDTFLKAQSHKAALEENALPDAYEYHAALLEFEKRGFPTLDDPHNGLVLAWKGAWPPHKSEQHATLLWDRACVTYNIVAMLTAKAADCSLSDRASCRQAVGLYQQAAGILVVLRDFCASMDFATVDLSKAILQFWLAYCMAEGQTFVYRMASQAADAKHSTLSYLAQSAFNLWNDALQKAQEPRLESEVSKNAKEWATYAKSNAMLSAARAQYHMAVVHRLEHKWGLELARLKECGSKLDACHEFLQSVAGQSVVDYTRRECNAIRPVVKDRYEEAEKDNYNVYQDDVPKTNPDIAAKQLIKESGGYVAAMLTPSTSLFVGL